MRSGRRYEFALVRPRVPVHHFYYERFVRSDNLIRLLESDAKWLFHWGRPGTPVRILGHYDFSSPRPWMEPAWWSRSVTLPGSADTPSDSDTEEQK